MALPSMTDEQRKENAHKAAVVRHMRAVVKHQLKHGEIDPVQLLNDKQDTDLIGRMRVYQFLKSCKGIGEITAHKIMDEVGIPGNRRIKGLGSRQYDELIRRLSDR